jgi:hypothetical protein
MIPDCCRTIPTIPTARLHPAGRIPRADVVAGAARMRHAFRNGPGQLARRIEALLALFPEGSAAQFILTSDRHIDLDPWLGATSRRGCCAIWRNRVFAPRERSRFATKGPCRGPAAALLHDATHVSPLAFAEHGEGLRFAFRGARTIEQRFMEAYAAEKRALLERAEQSKACSTSPASRSEDWMSILPPAGVRPVEPERPVHPPPTMTCAPRRRIGLHACGDRGGFPSSGAHPITCCRARGSPRDLGRHASDRRLP